MRKTMMLKGLLVAMFFLSGCGPQVPTKYFLLPSAPVLNNIEPAYELVDVPFVLENFLLSDYLAKSQLVNRLSEYQLDYSKENFWSHRLSDLLFDFIHRALIGVIDDGGVIDGRHFDGSTASFTKVRLVVERFDGGVGQPFELLVYVNARFKNRHTSAVIQKRFDLDIKSEKELIEAHTIAASFLFEKISEFFLDSRLLKPIKTDEAKN